MIDPQRRADRVFEGEDSAQELWEVYATNPNDPKSNPETATVERPS
jgi:hypothetical protein